MAHPGGKRVIIRTKKVTRKGLPGYTDPIEGRVPVNRIKEAFKRFNTPVKSTLRRRASPNTFVPNAVTDPSKVRFVGTGKKPANDAPLSNAPRPRKSLRRARKRR